MFDELWSEIADAPGEIFDIPEMRDDEDNDDRSFNAFLNSNWDFWWKLSPASKTSSLSNSGI